ncbi:MAG: EamA family transporter [Elusimicrobiaceae bacterium]|nr:EamA family transporter [Elusimicrobiaceae bacterium]
MKKSPIVAIWIAWFVTAANLIVGKFAVPYITSALFLFLSCAGAVLCFVPHIQKVNGWKLLFDKKLIWQYLGLGTLGTALPMTVFMIALNFTTPTNAAILNQFEIVYSILLAWLLLKERPTLKQIGGSLLVISGVTLLLWQAGFSVQLKGDLMIIGCLWMFQLSHIFAKKLPTEMDPQLIAAARALFALPALFLLIIYIVCTQGIIFTPVSTLWWTLLFSAVINYFLGNTFWYYAIRNMDLGKASAIILSYPVMTFVLSALLGLDKITIFKVLGLLLALFGAYIVTGIVKTQGDMKK